MNYISSILFPSRQAPIPTTKGAKGLNDIQDVIRFEILKNLNANDLCNVFTLNRSWCKWSSSKPLWTVLAKQLNIPIMDPENVKKKVIENYQAHKEINKKLGDITHPQKINRHWFTLKLLFLQFHTYAWAPRKEVGPSGTIAVIKDPFEQNQKWIDFLKSYEKSKT